MISPADELHFWTIYKGTTDVRAPFCVREWRVVAGGGLEPVAPAIPAQTLAAAREHVPDSAYRVERHPTDDPVVVETWI